MDTDETQDAVDLSENESDEDTVTYENVVDLMSKSIFAGVPGNGALASHPRWSGKIRTPRMYSLEPQGLIKRGNNDNQNERIAGPLAVVAKTCSPDGDNAGLILEFEGIDLEIVTYPIPRSRLHEDACILGRDLANLNYQLNAGKEKELLMYISQCEPLERRISATQTGWNTSKQPGKLVYVLPNSSTEPGYHFQPERYSPSSSSAKSAGTLKDWIDNVFDPSPYPLLTVCAALAAPLLRFSSMPTGGFHFYGGSSSGKTTLAQIAASVFGNGADPADAPSNPYTKRWNTTLNALEGLAVAHNDMPLVLDELGSCDSKNYSRMIYDLAGGQGKSAMDSSRNLRRQRSWRTVIVSTGEISSLQKIEESAYGKKQQAKAGQLIRLIDLAVRPSMFPSRQHVDRIKQSCAQSYGTLGPAFVKKISEIFTEKSLTDTVMLQMNKSLDRQLVKRGALNSVQERALKFFALAETAGRLLAYLKIIPDLTSSMIDSAIDAVLDEWIPASMELSDSERALQNLRDYILRYQDSRFKTLNETGNEKIQIAGYISRSERVYYLLPEAFREATGNEIKAVGNALHERGWLIKPELNRLTAKITIDDQRIYVYGIRAEFLTGENVI